MFLINEELKEFSPVLMLSLVKLQEFEEYF